MQLIFAFEAVVIGGIGSLWGTLLGGIVLGVAQNVGAAIDPRWFLLAGHLTFLAILPRCSSAGSAPRRPPHRLGAARMSGRTSRRALDTALSVFFGASWPASSSCWRPAPLLGRRQRRRQADGAFRLRHPGGHVERAGRLRRACFGRPAGVFRHRRLFRHPALVRGRSLLTPSLAAGAVGGGGIAVPISYSCCGCAAANSPSGCGWSPKLSHLLVNQDRLVQGETGTSMIALKACRTRNGRRQLLAGARRDGGAARAGVRLLRGRLGASMQAIRDDEDAAASLGVRVLATKRTIFILAAFGCAMAGVVWLATSVTFQPRPISACSGPPT